MKKTAILSIALLLGCICSAQNCEALQQQGKMAIDNQEFDSAEHLLIDALECLEHAPPTFLKPLVQTDLAVVYEERTDYAKSDSLYQEAVRNWAFYPDSIAALAVTKGNWALLHRIQGDLGFADSLVREAIALGKTSQRADMSFMGVLYDNLSTILQRTGDLENAMTAAKAALSHNQAGTLSFCIARSSLATIYQNLSRYDLTEKIHLENLAIMRSLDLDKHSDYGAVLANLGILYMEMGRYAKATQFLEEAGNIMDKAHVSGHHLTCVIPFLQAKVSYHVRDFTKSIQQFNMAIDCWQSSLGSDHPHIYKAKTSLAASHLMNGDVQEADSLLRIVIPYDLKRYPKDHINRLSALQNWGIVKVATREFHLADSLLHTVLEAYRKRGSDYIQSSYSNLSFNYVKQGYQHKSGNYLDSALFISRNKALKQFKFLSETERYQMVRLEGGYLLRYLSHLSDACSDSTHLVHGFEHTAFKKNLQLRSSRLMRSVMAGSEVDSVSTLYTRWVSRMREYGSLSGTAPDRQWKDPMVVLEEANILEKQLSDLSTENHDLRSYLSPSHSEIRSALLPGEALVEFVRFPYGMDIAESDSVLYGAFVVLPEQEIPTFRVLCKEDELAELIRGAGELAMKGRGGIKPRKKGLGGIDQWERGYQLIWKELEPLIPQGGRVWVSPAGLLHQLNLGLLSQKGKHLLEDHDMRFLLSSSALLDRSGAFPIETALLIGAPSFPKTENSSHPAWKELPWSAKELEISSDLLRKEDIEVKSLSGPHAHSGNFRSQIASNCPDLIHIATHGYNSSSSLTAPTRNRVWNERYHESMLQSGLVLSSIPQPKPEAGSVSDSHYLTAHEVSLLDLSQTKLVVLSACLSGSGDILLEEGILGLQRAFKLAGAKHLLVNLHEVDDQAACEFMAAFYQELAQAGDVELAFRNTQLSMLRDPAQSLQDWGGFILTQ